MSDQSTTKSAVMDPKPQHPLHQIADTPTHKLLLKQWLKEEELIMTRTSLKETQIDGVRKEITTLYTLFFIFHSLSLLLLFNISSPNDDDHPACRRSWVPSLCSLVFSMSVIWAIRYKTDVECHLEKLLEREKEDQKLLARCVDELKKKGVEFDLLKEVDALRRAKSMRIESAKAVKKWSPRDFVSMSFFEYSVLLDVIEKRILDRLLAKMWEEMGLVRVYTKPQGQQPDFSEPVVLSVDRGGCTVEDFCNHIHRTLVKDLKYALVWGTSARHYPQHCGLSHSLHDEDVVQIVKKKEKDEGGRGRFKSHSNAPARIADREKKAPLKQ